MIALGVDGGGSKTFAVTVDETGRVRGFGRGGCGNYEGPGLEAAMAEVLKACGGALQGARGERAQAGCFGLAGADFPEDFEMLEAAVRKLDVADDVRIYNDTRIAFHAGSRSGWGAVVIMGSGMNAAAFAPDGRECRLPGEGYLFGDWGGAGSVGREVLHLVFRAHDGRGRPTSLTPLALQHLRAADMDDLTRKLYRGEVSSEAIAGLAPLAFRAAADGDDVARVIVDRLADETAGAALAMLRRLRMQHDKCDVVLGGGIYKGAGAPLVDRARALILAGAPRADVIVPDVEPVIGAAILALQQAGVTVDNAVRANLKQGNDELVAPRAVPSLDDRCEE